MVLDRIDIHNFKNISRASLQFAPKINCLIGLNAMGKTNMLDAIYYLSFCKSFSGQQDSQLVTSGQDFMMLKGVYRRNGIDEEVTAGYNMHGRKTFGRGGKEYKRLSAHVGQFPAVMVSPSDIELITGASEVRRRFLDMLISQSDARYLESLIRYNNLVQQRNSMLRSGVADAGLYAATEMMMDAPAAYITSARRDNTQRLQQLFAVDYPAIAGTDEGVTLTYRSWQNGEDDAPLSQVLDHYRQRDIALRHTSVGPHRDDLDFEINGMAVKRTASQGQTKTYTTALRLAQYSFLSTATGLRPLLLLDDVFDKLDAGRVERIIALVSTRDAFGQIFVTDTNRRHTDSIIAATNAPHTLWNVESGAFSPINL